MAKQWMLLVIGLWVMISPWLLSFSEITLAKWSNVICGLVLIVWGAWEILNKKVV